MVQLTGLRSNDETFELSVSLFLGPWQTWAHYDLGAKGFKPRDDRGEGLAAVDMAAMQEEGHLFHQWWKKTKAAKHRIAARRCWNLLGRLLLCCRTVYRLGIAVPKDGQHKLQRGFQLIRPLAHGTPESVKNYIDRAFAAFCHLDEQALSEMVSQMQSLFERYLNIGDGGLVQELATLLEQPAIEELDPDDAEQLTRRSESKPAAWPEPPELTSVEDFVDVVEVDGVYEEYEMESGEKVLRMIMPSAVRSC